MKTAIQLIEDERMRQQANGYTLAHDDQHTNGELVEAAQCYATVGSAIIRGSSREEWPVEMFDGFHDSLLDWPWEEDAYKPAADARTNLVMAAALIVAEIERLHRAAGREAVKADGDANDREFRAVLAVPCPYCHAKAGDRCHSPRSSKMAVFHTVREKAGKANL